MSLQRGIFAESEGDAWYQRNRAKLNSDETRFTTAALIKSLMPFADEINTVVEVGCATGSELERICLSLSARGLGIEPSQSAASAGNDNAKAKQLDISIMVGSAEKLAIDDECADLVFFGFCLYLVDRKDLFQALSEAHRVLRLGGYLAILDFDPVLPQQRRYQHHDGVLSYKQDYSKILLASEMYSMLTKHTMSHSGDHFTFDPDERISMTILHKEVKPYPDWQG